MITWLEDWNRWVSGGAVPLALAVLGGYFLIRLRHVWLHPIALMRRIRRVGAEQGGSSGRAMSLALAGVLGVGNLVGVASAISYGGAGAIFWMWISATLAMLLKYAEIVLALGHRRYRDGAWEGCAMYYIEDSFATNGKKSRSKVGALPRLGKLLAGVFALLLLVDAVCVGGMIQVSAISQALEERLGISPVWVGGLLSVGLFFLGMRGDASISRLAQRLVPWMTLGFCVLSLAGIVACRRAVPGVLAEIVRQGTHLDGSGVRGLLGGVGAFFLSRAVRFGTMRGLLSNEGGCGTSPMAHADATTRDAVAQGGMGMLEVFVDTHLLCTMTALVLLLAFPNASFPAEAPMTVTILAFERLLGRGAGIFMCAAVLCFGVATVLCWSHYMLRTGAYLLDFRTSRGIRLRNGIFLFLYCAFLAIGSLGAPEVVWQLSDLSIGGMTLLNLLVLWRSRREILRAGRLQKGKDRTDGQQDYL